MTEKGYVSVSRQDLEQLRELAHAGLRETTHGTNLLPVEEFALALFWRYAGPGRTKLDDEERRVIDKLKELYRVDTDNKGVLD